MTMNDLLGAGVELSNLDAGVHCRQRKKHEVEREFDCCVSSEAVELSERFVILLKKHAFSITNVDIERDELVEAIAEHGGGTVAPNISHDGRGHRVGQGAITILRRISRRNAQYRG